MAFIVKTLGAGTLVAASVTADLYTVPSGKSALVSSLRLVNGTSAVTSTLNLYVKPSGANARHIHKPAFTIPASQSVIIEDLVSLGQGDKIQLHTGSTTPSLGYMVNGLERE